MANELHIELPDTALTAADLVGRAVRISRLNWFPLILFFLGPMLTYQVSYSGIWWDAERYDIHVPSSVSFWIVSIGIIFNLLALWELAVRKFGLLLFLSQPSLSLKEALKQAQKKLWLILLLTVPTFANEIGMDILAYLTTKIVEACEHASIHDPLMIWSLWLFALQFVLILPFICISMLNTFFITILIFENISIRVAFVRFWVLISQDFWYIASYFLLMASVFASTVTLLAIIVPIGMLLPQNVLRFIASNLASIILLTPIDTYLTVAATVGSALLYKQVSARLEGRDLLEKLNQLRSV